MKHLLIKYRYLFLVTLFIMSCNNQTDKTSQWNQEDYQAVEAAILDYVEALYEVDSTRIEKSVDPSLRKIGYYYGPDKKWRDNLPMTQKQLSRLAARWNSDYDQVNESSPKKIEIFEVSSKTASAKLTAAWGIDYFHLGKFNDQWKIMNVIWQSVPKE